MCCIPTAIPVAYVVLAIRRDQDWLDRNQRVVCDSPRASVYEIIAAVTTGARTRLEPCKTIVSMVASNFIGPQMHTALVGQSCPSLGTPYSEMPSKPN